MNVLTVFVVQVWGFLSFRFMARAVMRHDPRWLKIASFITGAGGLLALAVVVASGATRLVPHFPHP